MDGYFIADGHAAPWESQHDRLRVAGILGQLAGQNQPGFVAISITKLMHQRVILSGVPCHPERSPFRDAVEGPLSS